MALDIWRHYEYTLDEGFLREYYPVLKGAAECLSQLLERDDDTGCLVLNPSMSPENFFERDKKPYAMTRGTTVDTTICRMIFDAVIESAGILKDDDTLIDTLKSQRADLPPYKVGEYGQLQEWFKDEKEVFQDHRHTSHLLSLYPFETINPEKDKELAKACEVSIQRRFGKDEGDIVLANWAGCLILSYYAKLHKSEEADTLIHNMVEKLSRSNMMMTHTGPTSRPAGGIYELDGNTGFTAALCEMIAQQYDDEIIILPAIPSSWKSGEIKGLCMKGCIKLDIKWDEEEVYVSLHGSAARIRYKDQSAEASGCIVRFKR